MSDLEIAAVTHVTLVMDPRDPEGRLQNRDLSLVVAARYTRASSPARPEAPTGGV